MALSLAHVTFDCHDVLGQATFWSAALDRPVDAEASEFFATIGFPASPTSTAFMFIQVEEGKSVKNHMHIDMNSDDRSADVARLLGLGATLVGEYDEWGHQWTTLRDPEGNEFCVS